VPKQYKSSRCNRQFKERTGTDFNFLEWPNYVVMLNLYHYYTFKLSIDDVVDLSSLHNISTNLQTILKGIKHLDIYQHKN
jgi:hypothetical protein